MSPRDPDSAFADEAKAIRSLGLELDVVDVFDVGNFYRELATRLT